MIPGALAAMAAVLLSGRDDWQRRIAYFAMFGALGWSFGGSISYMQVVAYTHSGDSPSVLYGFACLFVIGFLWAALGGAGTALPAVVDHSFLDALFLPMGVVFGLWWLQGVAIEPLLDSVVSSSSGMTPTGWRRRWRSSQCSWSARNPAPARPGDIADPAPGRRLVGRLPGPGLLATTCT